MIGERSVWLWWLVALVSLPLVSSQSCTDDDEPGKLWQATPYTFPEVLYFPSDLNIPEDNPMTVEGVELGRYLFYDGRLSGRTHPDSLMSCASCHIQSKGFECGNDFPRAYNGHPRGLPSSDFPEGKPTPHVMLPVVNVVYNGNGYMWNGFLEQANSRTSLPGYDLAEVKDLNFKNLEAFTYMAIVAEHEMNGSVSKTVKVISSDPMYGNLFRKAYGTDEVTAEKISLAISQFVRTIVSYRSRYHQWMRQEAELTAEEIRGYELFFSEEADCFHCHSGPLLTNNLYMNNAKDLTFDDPKDRFSITGWPWDKGAYRVPSLVNVEMNGPYMHDGRFKTLDEVIDFYSGGLVYSDYVHPLMKNVHNGGVQLNDAEKADLKAFLLTFTDHDLMSDPMFQCPDALGEWGIRTR